MLAEVRTHSSAVNASTVYRTLEVLEGLGLVRHAHLSDRAPTYHTVTDHEHFHIVCRNCQKVVSVDPHMLDDLVDRPPREAGLRRRRGPPHGLRALRGLLPGDDTVSPLLQLPGAVAAEGIDAGVAAHYGSLHGEQAVLARREGFVDLSHRDVIRVERSRPAHLAALADHPAPHRAGARSSGPVCWC